MNQPSELEVSRVDDDQDGMIDEPILQRRYDSTTTKLIMNNDLDIGKKYCSCKTPRKKFRRFRSPKFSSDKSTFRRKTKYFRRRRTGNAKRNIACFICNKVGHFTRNCP